MLSWLFRNRLFLFIWATITGCLFALVWKQYEQTIHETLTYYRIAPSNFDYQWAYRLWLNNLGFRSAHVANNLTSENKQNLSNGGVQESAWLYEKVPILCIVMTKKLQQAKAVKNTWSKHCNKVLFYGPFNDASIPVNKIASKDNWAGLCNILTKVWRGYNDEFNWVLVTGDRTYAIIENLRYLIASLDHNQSHYLGHAYRDYDGQYNIDEAGYTLSWQTLKLLALKFADEQACATSDYWQGGGRSLGKFLEESGIKPKDTRDMMERSRFLSFGLDKLLIPGGISVFSRYWRDSVFLSPEGSGCCSDFVITFSDIPADKMYMMEYIIYHLKPVSHYWPLSNDNSKEKSTSTTPLPITKPTGKGFVAELTGGHMKKIVAKKSLSLSTETDTRSQFDIFKNLIKRLKDKSDVNFGVRTNLLEEDEKLKEEFNQFSKSLTNNDGMNIDDYDALEMKKEKYLKSHNFVAGNSKVDDLIKNNI